MANPRTRALPGLLALCLVLAAHAAENPSLERAVRSAFHNCDGATVVLRVSDSRVLAAHNVPVLTRRLLTPGSTVKPFTLELLLSHGRLAASDRIACRRNLYVRGRRLNCSHANGVGPFNASEALAFSCNSYFLEAARRIPPGELEQYMRQSGFESATGLIPGEAVGQVSDVHTVEDRQLLAIGAAGIEITPLELAVAYARVARWRKSPTQSQRIVLEGLEAATSYGLARLAQPKSVKVAGKTGTASNRGNATTHAWFAGFAPADDPQIVIVVYVERGRGSVEAASIARRIFEAWAEMR